MMEESLKIRLSDHFGYRRLIRFTMPTILMMIFISIYGVVDGFFVSNFVGKIPFAAVNFIMPFLMIVGAFGFMFGTGGSALIAKTMGEGDDDKAQQIFSLVVWATFVCGVIGSTLTNIFLPRIAALLGAEGEMLGYCVTYGRVLLISTPFLMLQYAFTSLVVTAEKPRLGLILTIVAGVTNMVGDFVFIAVFKWGVVGAALASVSGEILGGIVPVIYFARKNSSRLRLGLPRWDGKAIAKSCSNGMSELLSSISTSMVGMLYNVQLMKYAGENGVAAYGTIMYVNFIFIAIFVGYSTGAAPILSYHYGAGNKSELKSILKKSVIMLVSGSVFMFLLSELMAPVLAGMFVGYDAVLYEMTTHAFRVYSFSFIFVGMAVYGSSFFTALNDGVTSAIISFMRTVVFECACVILLPLVLGLDGIWASIIVAEAMAVIVSLFFMFIKRKKYGYW